MNPNLVTKITTRRKPVGMETNAGTKRLTLEGTVKGLGHTWYDPMQVATIFGFSQQKERYRITYASEKEDEFLVHTKPGITKFKESTEGLCAFKPPNIYMKYVAEKKNMIPPNNVNGMDIIHTISTIKQNKMGYTQRAKAGRRLYQFIDNSTTESYNIF